MNTTDSRERDDPAVVASFRVDLNLPAAAVSLLVDASRAVKQEYQDASRWKRLTCRHIALFAEQDRGTIFIVHVGHLVEFDWTWEGAIAFAPSSLKNPAAVLAGFDGAGDEFDAEVLWSGEVVEVDEQNGCLFISLQQADRHPVIGDFFVRPFEFLASLNSVFNAPQFSDISSRLPARLAAAKGGIHPLAISAPVQAEKKSDLQQLWQHSWSVLWGPPGTGKTFHTGQQVATILSQALLDGQESKSAPERILVISTTNRATDTVAISIGNAVQEKCPHLLEENGLLRIGKGAAFEAFKQNSLEAMLRSTAPDSLIEIAKLGQQLTQHESTEDRAFARKQIGELRIMADDRSSFLFLDPETQVVIATAFKAMMLLGLEPTRKLLAENAAPFTTIVIDEAGLMSRAAIAALSLLASRRVILVGDSKQLAPISSVARILPSQQQTWLASSGLSHLDQPDSNPLAVQVLFEQRRMHPEICQVVSNYQYGNALKTAAETIARPTKLAKLLADQPRAIWYVLDEEDPTLSNIRAERGPGNRSWIRVATQAVLEKLFAAPEMRSSHGLFISPYRAQAQWVKSLFGQMKLTGWESSTVHSQQGHEAEIVIFDTVNAGSTGWPYAEWKRLVNVALSRARQSVIVLASRNEMEEPHLRPLVKTLSAQILVERDQQMQWKKIDIELAPGQFPKSQSTLRENSLGYQIEQRQMLKPILSREQQQLSNLKLDGKPRLVRGVAGSGKSVVLANWLVRVLNDLAPDSAPVWAVYSNRALHKLLRQSIEAAWAYQFPLLEFPWSHVQLFHIQDILVKLLPTVELNMSTFQFDYDQAAGEFLQRQNLLELLPRCRAMFIDEAQDLGPQTLRLLLTLVEQSDLQDQNSRAAHIFYDDAQNIYGCDRPQWSDFGIDLRGRSAIMKESFRSTRPIMEFAVNTLYRLTDCTMTDDLREQIELGLIQSVSRNNQNWLQVRYNQVEGPSPQFHKFDSLASELAAIGGQLEHWIANEDISPRDICLLYNGESARTALMESLGPRLAKLDVELSWQKNRDFDWHTNTIMLTTPHSFKGYEAEVVLIPFVDHYISSESKILSHPLYVAMTRARSILAIYSLDRSDRLAKQLTDVLEGCLSSLKTRPLDGGQATNET